LKNENPWKKEDGEDEKANPALLLGALVEIEAIACK